MNANAGERLGSSCDIMWSSVSESEEYFSLQSVKMKRVKHSFFLTQQTRN